MIHFVGAGSGAVDLITVRGQRLLSQADLIIYAGSLVNPALLEGAKPGCQVAVCRSLKRQPRARMMSAFRAASTAG